VKEADTSARAVGQHLVVLNASTEAEINAAFAALVERRAKALLVSSDPLLAGRREQIVALARRHAVPSAYQWREFVDAGGLISYGTSITDAYRHAGAYTARVLKGERPADLPVQQSVKVELVINLKTAKALGLEVPTSILLRADDCS
jgi:putative ABC transport system substrate-binding protein